MWYSFNHPGQEDKQSKALHPGPFMWLRNIKLQRILLEVTYGFIEEVPTEAEL
jgi:hypothetical protein